MLSTRIKLILLTLSFCIGSVCAGVRMPANVPVDPWQTATKPTIAIPKTKTYDGHKYSCYKSDGERIVIVKKGGKLYYAEYTKPYLTLSVSDDDDPSPIKTSAPDKYLSTHGYKILPCSAPFSMSREWVERLPGRTAVETETLSVCQDCGHGFASLCGPFPFQSCPECGSEEYADQLFVRVRDGNVVKDIRKGQYLGK